MAPSSVSGRQVLCLPVIAYTPYTGVPFLVIPKAVPCSVASEHIHVAQQELVSRAPAAAEESEMEAWRKCTEDSCSRWSSGTAQQVKEKRLNNRGEVNCVKGKEQNHRIF